MAYNQWGASPLYENEDLKEGSIPTVTPIEQVRDEGNCASRAPANHLGDRVFSASVDASPTQFGKDLNEGFWLQYRSGNSTGRPEQMP